MIPTYNNGHFLAEAIGSVLRQDEGEDRMEIVVVDDGSTQGNPAECVSRYGGGRVRFVQQERNVGHIQNFQTCLELSRGEAIHLLHGDDLLSPGFYTAMAAGLAMGAGAAFCTSRYIDANGRPLGTSPRLLQQAGLLSRPVELLAREQQIMTPSIVVLRSVYETLGGFDHRLECAEDWEMWVRIASRYSVWHDPATFASYRMHDNSNTGRNISSAADMAFTRTAIEIFSSYVPPDTRAMITRTARKTYAQTCIGNASRLVSAGNVRGAFAQTLEAFRMAPSPSLIWHAVRELGRVILRRPRS